MKKQTITISLCKGCRWFEKNSCLRGSMSGQIYFDSLGNIIGCEHGWEQEEDLVEKIIKEMIRNVKPSLTWDGVVEQVLDYLKSHPEELKKIMEESTNA